MGSGDGNTVFQPSSAPSTLILYLNSSKFLKPEQFQFYHHASDDFLHKQSMPLPYDNPEDTFRLLGATKSGIYDSILHVNLELSSKFPQVVKPI